jgi:hypothetical protein
LPEKAVAAADSCGRLLIGKRESDRRGKKRELLQLQYHLCCRCSTRMFLPDLFFRKEEGNYVSPV